MQVLLGCYIVAVGMVGEIDDGQAATNATIFNDRDSGQSETLKPLLKAENLTHLFLNSSVQLQ
jgi:hypothetical protein